MPDTQKSSTERLLSKSLPAEYDGPALGRDDPVWPYYLKESESRDTELIEGWNKGMDALLLFAALFSAIVTAFLIESHKSLQPDTALIIAAGVSRMVDIMEARASSEPAPSGVPLPKLDNFHPSQKDIVVNGLWFFSLALSMLVTLLAMLVKEWANVYRREDRFTPYYVQARTRQARYDGLEDWGAKFVVRSLPVLMHIALGLFLLGLVIFLDKLKLSSVLMQLVLLVVLITLVLYVIMTKAWRFLKSGVYGILRLGVGEDSFTLPGERKERTRSTSTALDKLAAQAVVWLVSYSQAEESVDAGTRAIADANAERGFWNHLTEHEVVTLMAQRFTSFFKGTLDRPWPEDASLNDVISSDDLGRMSLCSRALAKLAKRSTIQLIQATTPHSTISGREEKEPGCIMLPEAYCISVQDGLHRLTESGSAKVAASGFCGASAWHTSTGRTNQNGKGYLLTKLARFLRDKSSELPDKLLADIVETLATETSYMTREQQEDDMNQALRPLIELCLLNPPNGLKLGNGPARKGISTELAVIAALINNYPGTPNMTLTDPNTIGYQYDESYEAYKRRYPYSASSYLAYSRQWRAVWIAEICAKNPKYLEEHSDALLLLGLAGILRSYRMSPSEFTKVVDLFTAELESNRANCSGRMSLPYILAPSCDVQSQIAQDILTAFHNQSFAPSNETEKTKLNLLKCLIQHGQWVEFWPNFFAEILKVLKSSSNKEIQRECILTLDNY
ncbi:unnamed protein product [Rhizoctonia solani]|uniref:DUF6535 domain-containing protein n=1 Tax=Rhizoctonia solani TaxID=456999 RepID=A0A8H3BI32_9AGAM|nr:unnamed protein product [Rhizoctonia solani]